MEKEKDPILKKLNYMIYQMKTMKELLEKQRESFNKFFQAAGLPTIEESNQKTKTNKK